MSIKEDLESFIAEWQSDKPTLTVYTSGSTGTPKPIEAEKQKMIQSAQMTCSFLKLKKSDTILLCMPLKYIAGKMVVVRSIVWKMNLISIEPTGHPFAQVGQHINFAALTPMQVYNTLNVDIERQRLMQVDNIIIGGGPIDDKMAAQLKKFPNNVWSTYGMTETLSHIALRRLSGNESSEWYTPFENVKISLSEKGTLVIDAPQVCDKVLVTNDIVEINKQGQFKIIGRLDNVINSGGIKIQIEEVEATLRQYMEKPFVITSRKDSKYGEIVVIISESDDISDVKQICTQYLPKYWIPRMYILQKIPFTATNKPDRSKAKEIAKNYIV